MPSPEKNAVLYRMVLPDHICPYGLKARHLLRSKGYHVDDRLLTTRAEVDAFKEKHGVATTPQIFIDGERVGGHDDLRRHLGLPVADPSKLTYRPVLAVFAIAAALAVSIELGSGHGVYFVATLERFISLSMVILALLKLQDVERFATMFLNYDLLARKWVPYGRIYPFAEGLAGVLMAGHLLPWLSIPIALFIGTIGMVSVFKAVYIDQRELKCACVGGNSNVPLGFVSLTENVMMVAMALWMSLRLFA
ncbi:MAG: MauE/DoxX family redox-associated membrane protein [Sphingorhabdus sp.]